MNAGTKQGRNRKGGLSAVPARAAGGRARAAALTSEQRKEIAKQGAKARQAKVLRGRAITAQLAGPASLVAARQLVQRIHRVSASRKVDEYRLDAQPIQNHSPVDFLRLEHEAVGASAFQLGQGARHRRMKMQVDAQARGRETASCAF